MHNLFSSFTSGGCMQDHSHSRGCRHTDHHDNEMIRLPGSPFWNVFKRFGRDEMIALAISVVGTTLAGFITTSTLILAFVGPIIEKIGFFPAHIHEAMQRYREVSPQERKPLLSYFMQALRSGSVSLMEDILVHDPIYIFLFFGLSFYPGIPVWLMTSSSFLVAVVMVAWLEVGVTEARYALFKRRTAKAGFNVASYYEARFLIRSQAEREGIISQLQSGLGLKLMARLNYHDRYFKNNLPDFSGRAPVVRLRRRMLGPRSGTLVTRLTKMTSTGHMQTVQVVYARPQEEVIAELDQFRYFPVRKDKFYWFINEEDMPDSAASLPPEVQQLIRADHQQKEISFQRTVFLNEDETLYAAIDTPLGNQEAGCIIELKVYQNPGVLLSAMRFVMTEFPVQHTTRTKSELSFFV
ncbi:MAG: hypothetical protein HZB99_03685 [Candidatus Harrisonbacteria bacterium]|nr:hypothetical protein [Candidatus Harrisonbacteria bacterium]